MGFNKKVLSQIKSDLNSAKAPARKKDIIVDPAGQWKYPGQVTRIPSNQITMQGVNYPVLAQPNIGQPQMMYPGQDYNFPGADYVDEYPQMKKGGAKKYSRSLEAKNVLFTDNPLIKKKKKKNKKIFNPRAKYYQDGGSKLGPVPLNSGRKTLRDWTYGESIGMLQEQDGGEPNSPQEWGESIKAVEREVGNPEGWTYDDLSKLQGKLYEYKAWRESTPEGRAVIDYHNIPNEYEVPLPKQLNPAAVLQKGGDISIPQLTRYQNGGYLEYEEAELTPEEIEEYRKQGYIIEEY